MTIIGCSGFIQGTQSCLSVMSYPLATRKHGMTIIKARMMGPDGQGDIVLG